MTSILSSAPPAAPSQPGENPTFTLFYFNVKALAEPIRFLFAYGAQEYEDVRVTRDEWPALKPSLYMQMNQLIFFFWPLLLLRISKNIVLKIICTTPNPNDIQ